MFKQGALFAPDSSRKTWDVFFFTKKKCSKYGQRYADEVIFVSSFFYVGFERRLPGFPRYSVQGSDHSGVFSLRVSNATEDDDAEFECQVGPAPGGNKPIRASARLKVLREYLIFWTFCCCCSRCCCCSCCCCKKLVRMIMVMILLRS